MAPKVNVREMLDKRNALVAECEGMLNDLGNTETRAAYDTKVKEINDLDEVLSRVNGLENLRNKPMTQMEQQGATIGMSQKELRKYSIMNILRAQMTNGKNWRDAAPFEAEVSDAVAKRTGKVPQGALVPEDVTREKRDLDVGTTTAGGYFKATQQMSMIEMLRSRIILQTAGATTIDGLVGDVAFPKQTSAGTAYWVTEGNAPTESQQAIGQVLMQPKSVAGWTEYTRKLMNQASESVENFVRADLAAILARAIDAAGLHGASNGPTGIAATSGVGSVAGGTNGLAPTWTHITALEREVAIDNADVGALAYITNPKVRYKLKNTLFTATYGDRFVWGENREQPLNGYPAHVTTQVSSTLTKGTSSSVCSAIFFGNWAEVLIGFWSGLDILLDPYALGTSGGMRVVAFQDTDIAVRHAESFAVMLDALTA
jgi:HK97 family phage major capsid protein